MKYIDYNYFYYLNVFYIIITKNINFTLQHNINNDNLTKLQKTLKTIQMERDMLLKRIENDKLIQDNSSNNDVRTRLLI